MENENINNENIVNNSLDVNSELEMQLPKTDTEDNQAVEHVAENNPVREMPSIIQESQVEKSQNQEVTLPAQEPKQVVEQTAIENTVNEITPEVTITEPVENKKTKSKKKLIILFLVLAVIASAGFFAYRILYDSTEIKWDTKEDGKVTHTFPRTLSLKVIASDRTNPLIKNIKYTVTGGEIKTNKNTVEWTLPDEPGKYSITAKAPSGKSVTKEVVVLSKSEIEKDEPIIGGMIETKLDEETDDSDNDGLTNEKEKELGTDPYSADTDDDGLIDIYEIEQSKTDPLKTDTDGDGINDGNEVDLGLDPLKQDSLGDGVKDGDRVLEYKTENKNGVSVEIKGKGNIASTSIDVFENKTFDNIDGLLNEVYNFYTTGKLESAIVRIKYNPSEIQAQGLNEDNLILYYFNENSKSLEPVETEVDKENHELIVTLTHFSQYVIGDKDEVETENKTDLLFVIDNSLSMYSEEQVVEAGLNTILSDIGNDPEFKRLTLTNKMVDMFTGNFEFGVAEFAAGYKKHSDFTTNKEILKNAVNGLKSNWSVSHGTNIIFALESGIKEFNDEEKNHYLILLTDGKNKSGSLSSSKADLIEAAKEKDVKICIIGLGNDIDTLDLDEIAEETGCDYFNASEASTLDSIYDLLAYNINYNLIDTDGDNETDGMIQANSGFIANRDGFSFNNFVSSKSSGGHCYGMATFASLYYQHKLPTKLDALDNSGFYPSYLGKLELASLGYDLTGTYFESNSNLYDFKITDPGLLLIFGETPDDIYDRVENDTLMIKKEYLEMFEKDGFTILTKDAASENDYKYVQKVRLNLDNETLKANAVKDDVEILDAIWRLFVLQVNDKKFHFRSEPDQAWEALHKALSNGIPQVISINGNHAVNATKLIQDSNDANKYKIEIYDNNYEGQTRYITVTRKKFNKIQLNYSAWTNEYEYKFSYDSDDDGKEEDNTLVSVAILDVK